MKVSLNFTERIHLQTFLSTAVGNYILLKECRELKESLGFTGKETKECKIKGIAGGGVSWNNNAKDNIFEISEIVIKNIFKPALEKMNDENALPDTHFKMYEIFVVALKSEKKKKKNKV